MQLGACGHTFNALYIAFFGIEPQHQTRQNGAIVNQNRARTTLAQFTTVLCARQIEIFA